MLHAIRGIEDARAQALLGFLQSVEEHALAIIMIGVALREECVVIEHVLIERPRIFG